MELALRWLKTVVRSLYDLKWSVHWQGIALIPFSLSLSSAREFLLAVALLIFSLRLTWSLMSNVYSLGGESPSSRSGLISPESLSLSDEASVLACSGPSYKRSLDKFFEWEDAVTASIDDLALLGAAAPFCTCFAILIDNSYRKSIYTVMIRWVQWRSNRFIGKIPTVTTVGVGKSTSRILRVLWLRPL